MTDNEIIKALKICGDCGNCTGCPFNDLGGIGKCMHTLIINALDLINRQNEEIERLTKIVEEQHESSLIAMEVYKNKAIKEFMAKAKCFGYYIDYPKEHRVIDEEDLDNLVKEMVGDAE